MFFIYVLFHSALAALVLAQDHSVHLENVLCYDCDTANSVRFPHCLEKPVRCGTNEVCRVQYGYRVAGHTPHTQCQRRADCLNHMAGHTKQCANGGVEVHSEYCQMCCQDDQCVTDVTDLLKLELIASRDLFCPHRCHVDNLKECVDNGRVCDHGDYCEIKVDHARQVYGDCRADHNLNHCQDGLQRLPCPENITNTTAYSHDAHHHCYSDCCNTNECLFKRFGIHLANATLPANQQTNVTSSPTGQGSDLWNKLHGSCVDTFSNVTCQGLKDQSDLCHSRLSLSMCPHTCGICDAVKTSVCQDWQVDNCAQTLLDKSVSFCQTTEAVFTCPVTCNVCDKLLDSIVESLIDGDPDSNQVPPSLLPTSNTAGGSTTTFPTVNCDDLHSVSCDHIRPVCESTFMGTVCQRECQACFNDSSIL